MKIAGDHIGSPLRITGRDGDTTKNRRRRALPVAKESGEKVELHKTGKVTSNARHLRNHNFRVG